LTQVGFFVLDVLHLEAQGVLFIVVIGFHVESNDGSQSEEGHQPTAY